MKPPRRFITLEGLDGCGKSTQLEMLTEHLRSQGHIVTSTREPGGTRVGQQIREVLLNASQEAITPLTELSLMFAARAQHIEQIILPALRRGELVLCDRFTDSSVAYQGYGRGVPLDLIRALENLLCQGLRPDLTLILEIDAATSLRRTEARNRKAHQPHTRFEQEDLQFFERVRQGYLEIARQELHRVRILDGSGTIEQLFAAVRLAVDEFLQSLPGVAGHLPGGGRGV
ncbi:MAG: dTMP kinase [Acidobacteria bacterium]|nr:dTMP kinase [Acidobacteriota bacterium]